MKKLVLILCLTLGSMTAMAASRPLHRTPMPNNVTHDGTWWQSKSSSYKEGYLTGYRQGLVAGKAATKAIVATKNEQIISGLDALYKDFRNANITVEDAVPYVMDELAGLSDEKLKTKLQTMRQAAATKIAANRDGNE